ncbi:MAG: HTTM domain-containing protein [Verrucomicrobiota bacterium]
MKRLQATSFYTPQQFGFFRILFGLYLSWHFASLIPYGVELFSDQGILGDNSINPLAQAWLNPFFIKGSSTWVTAWLIIAVLGSVLVMLGRIRRLSCLFLWYTWTCLFTANPLIANPSLAYIGLLLVLCTLIPHGECYILKLPNEHSKKSTNWKMPAMVCFTAWTLMSVGYTFSGVMKLFSPSWIDGSALQHLMYNPLARPGLFRDLMLILPESLTKCMTWSVLALEIAFVPLVIFRKTRPWVWLSMLLMHFGIMATVDFADLSLGMVMIHLFTFQSSWVKKTYTKA